jgi:hypothetical protein
MSFSEYLFLFRFGPVVRLLILQFTDRMVCQEMVTGMED